MCINPGKNFKQQKGVEKLITKKYCLISSFGMFRLSQPLQQARNFSLYRVLKTSYEKQKLTSTVVPEKPKQKTVFGRIVFGFHILKSETKKWLNEQKDHIFSGGKLGFTPDNEIDIIWKFNDTSSCNDWIVTCDSDSNQGFSSASFTQSSGGTGIFSGILTTRLPKDGEIRKSGYCNLCAPKNTISFFRERPRDWSSYNFLLLRVRGDGRPYLINIGNAGYFDINKDDLYTYTMYTRGGPYWQEVKIPFSKFILGNKGKIQDRQFSLDLAEVSNFNITLADSADGPFKLEIDHIGVGMDYSHYEDCAYEIYKY